MIGKIDKTDTDDVICEFLKDCLALFFSKGPHIEWQLWSVPKTVLRIENILSITLRFTRHQPWPRPSFRPFHRSASQAQASPANQNRPRRRKISTGNPNLTRRSATSPSMTIAKSPSCSTATSRETEMRTTEEAIQPPFPAIIS